MTKNNMKNLHRYIYGAMLGMIVEYLYRVEFSIIPLIIGILILSSIVIDIVKTDFKK